MKYPLLLLLLPLTLFGKTTPASEAEWPPKWNPETLDFTETESKLIEAALELLLTADETRSTREFYAPEGNRFILMESHLFDWDVEFDPEVEDWERVGSENEIGESPTLAIRIDEFVGDDGSENTQGEIKFVVWAGYRTNQIGGAIVYYDLDYATEEASFAGLLDP